MPYDQFDGRLDTPLGMSDHHLASLLSEVPLDPLEQASRPQVLHPPFLPPLKGSVYHPEVDQRLVEIPFQRRHCLRLFLTPLGSEALQTPPDLPLVLASVHLGRIRQYRLA